MTLSKILGQFYDYHIDNLPYNERIVMRSLIYLVGLIVVIFVVLRVLGLA